METPLFRVVMTAFSVYLTSAEVSLVGVLSRSNFIINLIFYEVLFALFISDPVFETTKDDGIFFSATFSPLDSMIIASHGQKDVKLFDIRQNSFRY